MSDTIDPDSLLHDDVLCIDHHASGQKTILVSHLHIAHVHGLDLQRIPKIDHFFNCAHLRNFIAISRCELIPHQIIQKRKTKKKKKKNGKKKQTKKNKGKTKKKGKKKEKIMKKRKKGGKRNKKREKQFKKGKKRGEKKQTKKTKEKQKKGKKQKKKK